jgi:hypothetical protein
MTETYQSKVPPLVEPCVRFTPAEAARNKKARDDRRRAIRLQNARTKTL